MALINLGRKESARSNYGGIQGVIFFNYKTMDYAPIVDPATGLVTSIGTSTDARPTGYKYDLRGTSSFNEPGAGGGSDSGTNVFIQNLELSLKTVTAADNVEVQNLATNRPHALVIDYKGGLWLTGRQHGLEIATMDAQRGANPEDFVGYAISLSGKERQYAEYAGELDAADAVPDGLFITVIEGATDVG